LFVDAVRLSDPSHGGIIVAFQNCYRCSTIALPQLNTFEGLCIRLSTGAESFMLLSIYRPRSVRPIAEFYDELTAVLESLVLTADLQPLHNTTKFCKYADDLTVVIPGS
jgi:hypothetical protein